MSELQEAIQELLKQRHTSTPDAHYSYIGIHRTETSALVLTAATVMAEIVAGAKWLPENPCKQDDELANWTHGWNAAFDAILAAITQRLGELAGSACKEAKHGD